MRLQPRMLPGAEWLHEQPPDKMMWLHVFGRLKPGVTQTQAEAQVNNILQANLKSFYGDAATASNARWGSRSTAGRHPTVRTLRSIA